MESFDSCFSLLQKERWVSKLSFWTNHLHEAHSSLSTLANFSHSHSFFSFSAFNSLTSLIKLVNLCSFWFNFSRFKLSLSNFLTMSSCSFMLMDLVSKDFFSWSTLLLLIFLALVILLGDFCVGLLQPDVFFFLLFLLLCLHILLECFPESSNFCNCPLIVVHSGNRSLGFWLRINFCRLIVLPLGSFKFLEALQCLPSLQIKKFLISIIPSEGFLLRFYFYLILAVFLLALASLASLEAGFSLTGDLETLGEECFVFIFLIICLSCAISDFNFSSFSFRSNMVSS
ncbi:unnamed protein product [Moneuplotes crassus]|uniref:Uncharacterized protein n=1 Tax=Euplotes crassus TaxID=5936 RepID=A0AAD1U4V3_EUPCR|nr:unnamed protein product [Moneuplotes crassus]